MTRKQLLTNLGLIIMFIIAAIILFVFDKSLIYTWWSYLLFVIGVILAIGFIVYGLRHSDSLFNRSTKTKFAMMLDWTLSILLPLITIAFLFMFFFDSDRVSGSSMEQTLYDGDRILIYHYNYTPQTGDIIIIQVTENDYFIKRVGAVPGDEVRFQYHATDEYYIYINDVIYMFDNQIYLIDEIGKTNLENELENGVMPENKYMVFGDNQGNSTDSRSVFLGLVDKDQVVGKAFVRLWPLGGLS